MSDATELSRFIEKAAGANRLRVEADLGDGFVRLRVSEAQRRQAKQDIRCVEDAVIEMLRNARDAHSRSIFLASSKSGAIRRLVVIDDGDGIPEHLHEAVFEPRVTSKLDSMVQDDWGVHGRGMALYSVRANAEEAYVAASLAGRGCAMVATFDTARLTERRDQSTPPVLVKDAEGQWGLGAGPHNIARITAEFALANRRACTVYAGSPTEVVATLRAFGAASCGALQACEAASAAPAKRLALARDASQLADFAGGLGLEISSRSAYRIIQEEIAPLAPYLETLERQFAGRKAAAGQAGRDFARDFRGLKLDARDKEEFAGSLKRVWADFAERYYLEPDVEPTIRVSHDGVHITFPVSRQL